MTLADKRAVGFMGFYMTKLFDRMFTLKKNMRSDNRGTTLVEIIVALLILVLIFTPAYMAFSAALKLNQASKDKLYAQTIAQNAMEIIKYNMDVGGSIKTINFTALSGSAVTATGAAVGPYDVSAENVRPEYAKYSFIGCPEGTSSYDISINIEDHEKNEAERQSFADMSAFNDTATALINPSGISGGFDSTVVSYFSMISSGYYNEEYQATLNKIYAHNNSVIDDYNRKYREAELAGRTPPEYPSESPDLPPDLDNPTGDYAKNLWKIPNNATPISNSDILKDLRKTMVVTVQAIGGQYRLNSCLEYRLKTNRTADNRAIIDPAEIVAKAGKPLMTFSNYCKDVDYSELKNLYIMYTPRADIVSGHAIKVEDEKIAIHNVGFDTGYKVFIVMQAPEGNTFDLSNEGLDVQIDGDVAVGNVDVFCNVNCSGTLVHYNSYPPDDPNSLKFSLIDEEKIEELIYDVNIEVKETGTPGEGLKLYSTVTKK